MGFEFLTGEYMTKEDLALIFIFCMVLAGFITIQESDRNKTQIEIAKRVFSPDPAEVAFARRVLEAMPDGTGAVMIDGRMQDDATWKQCKVVVDLAKQVAAKDPDFAKVYGF